jgi:hypothetical protein
MALKAVEGIRDLQDEIARIRKESGLDKLEAKLDDQKARVKDFMLVKDVPRLDVPGAHVTLVKGFYGATFVGTDDDIPMGVANVTPLRKIIYAKFPRDKAKEIWFRCTRRMIVKEQLEEVVAEGLLSPDEIAPSFVEKEKAPYVRVYMEG